MGWLDAIDSFLRQNTALAALIAVGIPFILPAVQFFLVRRREAEYRDFETYHRLIKELVQPDYPGGTTKVDRQAAVVFELRHFRRYREFSLRTLKHLRQTWGTKKEGEEPPRRLLEEMDLTIKFLER